ncbi:MAG: hypothetical protein EHV01_003385 [Spiroplasma sp. hy2]|uniref:hypothetical protein n=1 Tax=Spiroplasma sp. hy2 TaxID=2490850 RepID=UPI00383DECEA
MGYYYQHRLGFSFHCLQRIRERIPAFKNENDWIIKEKIIKMIDNSSDRIETTKNLYIKLDDLKGNLYVVVAKQIRLIVTVTPMSPGKLLDIITRN